MKLKFENVDVEQCLRSVMERNTKHYQSDFEYDVGSMERIAQTKHPERTPLFWMSRPSGTWCFREWDVFIRDSDAFYTWQFYKDTRDTILAYTVEITGMEGAAIKGNLYTQDYRAMAEHIERTALPAASVTRASQWNFAMRITMSISCPFTPNLAKPRNSGWSRLFRACCAGFWQVNRNTGITLYPAYLKITWIK